MDIRAVGLTRGSGDLECASMSTAITRDEVAEMLRDLPGWRHAGEALEKTFVWTDFSEALAFVVRVGLAAEKIDHHPEIINVWNRVTLRLCTHDAGNRVTARDGRLATLVEQVARPR